MECVPFLMDDKNINLWKYICYTLRFMRYGDIFIIMITSRLIIFEQTDNVDLCCT